MAFSFPPAFVCSTSINLNRSLIHSKQQTSPELDRNSRNFLSPYFKGVCVCVCARAQSAAGGRAAVVVMVDHRRLIHTDVAARF